MYSWAYLWAYLWAYSPRYKHGNLKVYLWAAPGGRRGFCGDSIYGM